MINDDGKIDYSGYALRELHEARSNINPKKYPENYANLVAEFERRGLDLSEVEEAQSPEPESSPHIYSKQAKSPIAARLTGLATLVFGIAWFLLRYDDDVYHGRRGREYTFAEDPFLVSFFFLMHATVVVIGLLGLIFGSQFYRYLIKSKSHSSPFKREN